MMNRLSLAIATAVACVAGSIMVANAANDDKRDHTVDQMPTGIHWARDAQPAHLRTQSPTLNYHGGPVMQGTIVEPIFWGVKWANATFAADKISGIQTFYSGVGSSSYANTTTEYHDKIGGVSTSVSLGATLYEYSTAANGGNPAPILAEVCAAVPNPASNGYYPVYVDVPRGRAKFCAWHSAGMCSNGATVQFAFFFDLDGDPGCDPQDSSGLHSQGLAALANVSGHELSETLTDPHLNAWYDANGQENADKCAWSFGTPLLTLVNGSQWKIQGNWSNRAFSAHTGYPNLSGQDACIDGGNFK